jgi:hypothetical protein
MPTTIAPTTAIIAPAVFDETAVGIVLGCLLAR